MIRAFLFTLSTAAAAAVLAEPLAGAVKEEPVRFDVRAPSGGREHRQGQVAAATLFGLVKRAGCDNTSLTGPKCPQGAGCCYYDETCCGAIMCLPTGWACCNSGSHSCFPDESCCGSGCMPSTAICCGDGTWSSSGQSGCSGTKIRAPAPTITDARYSLTSTSTTSSYSASTPSIASTPTFSTGTSNSVASGVCVGAQKVMKNEAAYKGGGGHGGGGGSSSDGSSSGSSSGSGTTSGDEQPGCVSSASMLVLSMGTLMGAFLSTIILM